MIHKTVTALQNYPIGSKKGISKNKSYEVKEETTFFYKVLDDNNETLFYHIHLFKEI